jgi:hypothetical protein
MGMRLAFLILTISLLAPACGQVDRDPPAAASGPPETTEQPSGKSEQPEGAIKPPPVVLESDAGRQIGVRGGYCVTNHETGQGLCIDTARPEATQASVVRPGEIVTIALEGARAVRSDGCHWRDMSCIGEITASPVGCKAKGGMAARVFLDRGSQMQWRVQLEPGAYELQLYFYFEADDGRSGDSSAALGLLVHPTAELAVISMPAAATGCP